MPWTWGSTMPVPAVSWKQTARSQEGSSFPFLQKTTVWTMQWDGLRKPRKSGQRECRACGLLNGLNDNIAVRTASFIVEQAVKYNVDTVVFEHLDTSGKKKGSKKQRLHFWKAQYVQKMVSLHRRWLIRV